MGINLKKKVVMLGSVPMSLRELPLAPAMLSSVVKKKGHEFEFIDINLRLYEMCERNKKIYENKINLLDCFQYSTNNKNLLTDDPIIFNWYDNIIKKISNYDLVLINVFSVSSQKVALRLCQQIRINSPHVDILMGGIGSHKMLLGGINKFNVIWAKETFPKLDSHIFGQVLLDHGLIDDWQSTVGTEVIESWLPTLSDSNDNELYDFDIYNIKDYDESNGTHKRIPLIGSKGCVRQCSFCDVIKHFPKYSFIEADQITKEIIKICKKTGIYKIHFVDSLVNGSISNFLSLLKNLTNAKNQKWLPENFSWSGSYICRPKSARLDEIHKFLPTSGVDNLIIGVESGSDRIRFEMKKKFLNTDLLYELTNFRKNNIKATLLFFAGWPTETEQDFQESLNLFNKLSEFAQTKTIESISLATSGFVLIDGTPIDKEKDKFGLRQGPAAFLWKCDTNPTLTFWEVLKRRFILAEWSEMLGIRITNENTYRRYVADILEYNQDVILDYCGHLPNIMNISQYLPDTTKHTVSMNVINKGIYHVTITIKTKENSHTQICNPGITLVKFDFVRYLKEEQNLQIDFTFNSSHTTKWCKHDSGDYYDCNGLYIENIYLDYCDITYYGWNQMVNLSWNQKIFLPDDYHQHLNLREITKGMELIIKFPKNQSPHKHFINCTEPELTNERNSLDRRINSIFKKFLK